MDSSGLKKKGLNADMKHLKHLSFCSSICSTEAAFITYLSDPNDQSKYVWL